MPRPAENSKAIEHLETARQINEAVDDEKERLSGIARLLIGLGNCRKAAARFEAARGYFTEALFLAGKIGFRQAQAAAHEDFLGELHILQLNWDEAAHEVGLAVEVADHIRSSQFSKSAREVLTLINLHRNDLAAAHSLADTAQQYDVTLRNHRTSAIRGLVALRNKELNSAREAFRAAIKQADGVIALTPDRYETLDAKAFSLCGLVLCGDPGQTQAAKAAYKAARAVTSEAGIILE